MPNDAAPWAQGYVSDIVYTDSVFRELAPAYLNHVALSNGWEPRPLEPGFTYCELGCGRGQSINVMAAANPQGQFYACDFNPTHVGVARKLAAAAQTTNLTVLERNFEEMRTEALPEFDFIVLHGVWSWIGDENRKHIVDFIYRKLKPGGLVYVSYNALPGWAPLAPLRQVMLTAGEAAAGDSIAKTKAGLAFVKQLRDAKAQYFVANPAAGAFVDRLEAMPANYLAHEYFNRSWTLCYSTDVARDMAAAKMRFIGSATLIENQRGLLLPKPMADLVAKQPSREMAELIQDYMINQRFRRDVFARGGTPLTAAKVQQLLADTPYGLTRPAADVVYKGKGPLAEFGFDTPIVRAIVAALSDGPRTTAQIAAQPTLAGIAPAQQQQMITLLVATGQVQAFARASANRVAAIDPKKLAVTLPFNRAILASGLDDPDRSTMISPLSGSGTAVDPVDRMFLRGLLADPTAEAVESLWSILERRGVALKRDGQALAGRDANVAELRRRHDVFMTKTLPYLVSIGIVETR